MCPPSYYGIEYEINPWMSRSRRSDRELAREQWGNLCRLITDDLAVAIELVEPRPGLPDMVFTANAGWVWRKKFIASNFRHEVRRGEAPHFIDWFEAGGFEIARLPAEHFFEGEGDLLMCGDLLFAGYHIRSDIASHQKAAEIIEREVLSLELVSDWFYHLDTCFCPLGAGKALYYPPAFDGYALKVMENQIEKLIPVDEEEACRFACNAIVAGDRVVMNAGCPRVSDRIKSLGFTVFETPLDEFIKAGGSAKCLALKIPHAE
jgi:N-dimethylarginine dimethylaminohydrolase